MKFKAKIYGLCPEREENYRTETFVQPKVEKVKKQTKKRATEEAGSGVETYATEIIEIKNREIIYEFPKENLDVYFTSLLPRKIMGALGDIRNYFNSKISPDSGGTLGLKKPFSMAWAVIIHSIDNIGTIIPNGYTKRFTYKGAKGGMGTQHYDMLDELELTLTVTNIPVKNQAPHIEKMAIEYLELVKFGPGRNASLEIIEVLDE